MNVKQHNNGNYTAVSDKCDVLAEGITFLCALIECGEMAEAHDSEMAGAA